MMIKRVLLWGLAILFSLTILMIGYIGITYWRASSGLPEWNGTLTAEGLDGPVEIIRDEHGIPYIEATTERDLYFAQGFVHAQDRFWQMALLRQRSLGRIAEWFGSPALVSDQNSRYWNWNEAAQKSWESFPEEERPLLKAYADGVNAWLNGPAYQRPPEMKILHIHPEPWRPQDSFLIGHQLYAPRIFQGLETARRIFAMLGLDAAAFDMHVAGADTTVRPIIESTDMGVLGQPTAVDDGTAASNSWVLSGAHTASGKPLMANDPHVPPTLPSSWQLQHLTWAGGSAAGVSIPGIPGISSGHNGRVAWSFTSARVDGTDIALLERHPEDPGRYRRGPGQPWQRFEARVETLNVRFAEARTDTFFITPQGRAGTPPALGSRWALTEGDGQLPEIRDVSFDHPNGNVLAALRMLRAENTEAGLAAAVLANYPSLNFSVADTAGDIGYVTATRVALRPEAHARFVAMAPTDGNDRTYLPPEENPRIVNPSSGRIVTANHQIVGDEYPHYLSDGYLPPTRAHRVHEALDATSPHDVASFVAMQNDALSPGARAVLPLMLKVEPTGEADAALLKPLHQWDYTFAPETVAPTIFTTWLFKLNRRLMADDLPGLVVFERWAVTRRALNGEHPEWCDDRRTEETESCSDLLRASLTDAREALEEALGPDPDGWTFGAAFPTRLPHMGFGGLPGLGGLFSREQAVPGGFDSLFFASLYGPDAPGAVSTVSHSSYQGVYDLSDLAGGSRYITPGGVSGHFKSPYYDNLTEMWVRGERITLNPEQIEEQYRLTLQPNISQ